MIQRKQSVFILLAMCLMASIMIWPIDVYASVHGLTELRWTGLWDVSDANAPKLVSPLVPLTSLVVISMVLNLVGLFLFKKRPLQMRLVGIASGVEFGVMLVLIYISNSLASSLGAELHFAVRWIVPLLAAVFDVLAYRGISDDEALVRSLDRLR